MLPCIVIDFFLNNQPDPLIIPILCCYKTKCFGHQDGTGFVRAGPDVTKPVPSWLWLEAVIRNLHENYQWRMYSRKLLMMGREDARNMWSFITE